MHNKKYMLYTHVLKYKERKKRRGKVDSARTALYFLPVGKGEEIVTNKYNFN